MPRRQHAIFNRIRPYHIVSKSARGRTIFRDDEDRARFIVQLYASNVGKPGVNMFRRNIDEIAQALLEGKHISEKAIVREHKPLVDLFSFFLGRDQYNLGLVPHSTGVLSRFMQKLNIGYAKYFNAKYKLKGTLMQDRFKGKFVRTPEELGTLIEYINIVTILLP